MKYRTVIWLGPGINPSTEKAFRVETVELLSRKEADKLRDKLNSEEEK